MVPLLHFTHLKERRIGQPSSSSSSRGALPLFLNISLPTKSPQFCFIVQGPRKSGNFQMSRERERESERKSEREAMADCALFFIIIYSFFFLLVMIW